MKVRPRRLALCGITFCFSLCCLTACKKDARSTSLKEAACCAAYQRSDPLPDQPAPGVTRLAIGGDSRDTHAAVVPWAFNEAASRGANAFCFVRDLDLTSSESPLFFKRPPPIRHVLVYPCR